MVSFTIQYDKQDKQYKSGQTVHCKVYIVVHSKFKARSLSIRFLGVAHTEWTKSRTVGSGKNSRTVHDRYTGDEEYFRQYINFVGQHNGSDNQILPGSYEYEASFILPQNLPSSYEHDNGFIRYSVKLKYDVPWDFDKELKDTFFVTSDLDLNEFQHLKEVVKETKKKTFCCCCCESDPLEIVNVLPKAGWLPGENIPVTIEIDNHSDVRIEAVIVRLRQKLVFITRSPRSDTRTDTENLKEHLWNIPVLPLQNKLYRTKIYLDPEYNFKLFNGCGIIQAEYYIKSEAISSGCHSNPDNSTNITIGTIPFSSNGFTQTVPLAPIMPLFPSAPYEFNPTLPASGVISEQPLPSYDDITKNMGQPGSLGFGWNLSPGAKGAPLASTEKLDVLDDDNIAPPSFEESVRTRLDKTMNNGAEPSAPALP